MILAGKWEIECFRRMISSSVITSDDVLRMFAAFKYSENDYHPLGNELTCPKVCELEITDMAYLDMKDAKMLHLDGKYAFVSINEHDQIIVWPLLSNEVYLFYDNPFYLTSYSFFARKDFKVKILERTTVYPDDTSVVQHDKGYRLFKVRKYCVIAKQDMVVSSLEFSGELKCIERMIYNPMWLLRNEPHNLPYEMPKQQLKSENSCDSIKTNMGEINE